MILPDRPPVDAYDLSPAEFEQLDDCTLAHPARVFAGCVVLGAIVILAGVWVA